MRDSHPLYPPRHFSAESRFLGGLFNAPHYLAVELGNGLKNHMNTRESLLKETTSLIQKALKINLAAKNTIHLINIIVLSRIS